jgi:MSHA biogenesis protein MshK
MVEHLIRNAALSACLLAAAGAAGAAPVSAAMQDMPDPMRPPAALGASRDTAAGAASGGPVLQSVLISPLRKIAIVDGQTVAVGDKVGDAKVVHISEGEVTLQSGTGVSTLKLFPNIEKQVSSARGNAVADKRNK